MSSTSWTSRVMSLVRLASRGGPCGCGRCWSCGKVVKSYLGGRDRILTRSKLLQRVRVLQQTSANFSRHALKSCPNGRGSGFSVSYLRRRPCAGLARRSRVSPPPGSRTPPTPRRSADGLHPPGSRTPPAPIHTFFPTFTQREEEHSRAGLPDLQVGRRWFIQKPRPCQPRRRREAVLRLRRPAVYL